MDAGPFSSVASTSGRQRVTSHGSRCHGHRRFRPAAHGHSRCATIRSRASDGNDTRSTTPPNDVKATIADLDALLGIEEEKPKEEVAREASTPVDFSVSAEALDKLRSIEDASTLSALERLVSTAKDGKRGAGGRLGGDSKAPGRDSDLLEKLGRDALQREVLRVAREVLPDGNITSEIVQVIKRDILGMNTFLVTEVVYLEDQRTGGVEFRGNLRVEAREAAALLERGLAERYGARFCVYLIFDESDDGPQENGKERVALQVLPMSVGTPPVAQGWQVFVALVLFALTLGSTLSLSALVSVPKLPVETLAWLAQTETPDFNGEVPGLSSAFDPLPFVATFSNTFAGIAAVSAVHEVAHRVVAAIRKVRLGPPLFVPNGSLGTFGAVSSPETAFTGRKALWDVAAAGPVAGLLVGGGLFAYGLLMSQDPSTDPALLVPVPSFLFQGSIVLGSVCQAVLGTTAAAGGKQLVHPALIAGWCTLFTQAFNLLPVGALDGGKMTQAAYGRTCLTFSSLLTYIGLTLGFIGGQLSLPFGLFVLIAQREPERYIKDQVTSVDAGRETATVLFVLLALLILVPVSPDAPELIDSVQMGVQSQIMAGPLPVDPLQA